MTSFDIVIPSAGRPSVRATVEAIRSGAGPEPGRIIVVDDRPGPGPALPLEGLDCEVLRTTGGRGPAAARNVGWRASRAVWIAFLDDDVEPTAFWAADLERDLLAADAATAGVQGCLFVPRPSGRRPTDTERGVAGLEHARWATADMAYRRAALVAAGGFDERFPRAYREDADLALRLVDRGWTMRQGERIAVHPVGPAPWWSSVRRQIGNRDDPLMRRLHGSDWRRRAGTPEGRLSGHRWTTAWGLAGAVAAALRRPHLARFALAAWTLQTIRFAWERVAPGPRDPRELAAMAATSVAIPPVAVGWWLAGWAELPRRLRAGRPPSVPRAVLLDRDGTLIADVPYNGDPTRVEAMPGAREAIDELRRARLPLAVVSNQSGIGRGYLSAEEVAEVNARVDELLGPFDAWLVCPHAPEEGCGCRKPAPGMVFAAAQELGVAASDCVVIGDIEADVRAAAAAGAASVLVPTPQTRPAEVQRAPLVAGDIAGAVRLVLEGRAA